MTGNYLQESPDLKTVNPPERPLLVWDGQCGFCHWWILRWKMNTGDNVDYEKYQLAAPKFPDVPEDYFQEAVRLIEPDGTVYGGAHAAFRAFTYGEKKRWLYKLYKRSKLFSSMSDKVYGWISRHRPMMYAVTVAMFGKNPASTRAYWLLYICLIVFFTAVLVAR